MKIPPDYKITPKILELISKVDANLIHLSSLNIPSKIKQNIQKKSLLNSALFSARIEGFSQEKDREVFDLLKAEKYVEKNVRKNFQIDKEFVYNLHSLLMFGEEKKTKSFRKEMGAIFNQAGVAVYISPPPTQVNQLINQLIQFVNSDKEIFPLILAFISHLIFEKIHPFLDGNGRVGRLLIFSILKAKGYGNGLSVAFEKYLNENKNDYYYFLGEGLKEPESYLVFMLKAFLEESNDLIRQIELAKNGEERLLPPRQQEIYLIIKDHDFVSFDNVKRRFLKVPERTLRYDLKKLCDKKLILKIGQTRGSYYRAV